MRVLQTPSRTLADAPCRHRRHGAVPSGGKPSGRCPSATGRYPAGEELVNKISVAPRNGVRGDDGPGRYSARYPRRCFFVSETSPAAVVILAAGEGKRMKSRTPKVLHTLCGRTLLGHALAAADELDPAQLVVVVGHGREQVSAEVASVTPQARIVRQDQQLGTGHAVRMVTESIGTIPGTVVISYAD